MEEAAETIEHKDAEIERLKPFEEEDAWCWRKIEAIAQNYDLEELKEYFKIEEE